MTNGGIRETNHWFAYGVDILVGVLLLVISWRFPGKSAFLIGLGSIFILALGGSLLAFGAYAYWFNFVPIMGGQLIELQWRRAREAGKLEHEVARLTQELAELKRDPKRGQTL